MSLPASPRLKYSKRLTAGAVCAAASATLGTASAAVSMVNVGSTPSFGSGWVSFNPLGSNFVTSYNDTSYMAGIRNCGLGLISFSTTNFQWASVLLTEGSVIGSSLSYTSPSNYQSYPSVGATAYAGYRVVNQGPGSNETYYGYVKVTGVSANTFSVDSYFYETSPSTSVTVVPEPSAAWLGLAGAGLLTWKRRRRA